MVSLIKNASRVLLFFAVISLLFIGADIPQALAQDENEPTGFKNVRLWIYPEYDDPRLLVMLEGQIAGVQAPAKVRFLVPSAAEMYSAGSMDAQGRYSGGPPLREPSAILGWDEISYEATTDTFRVEYYDPIIRGQPDKTISYEFRWLYPISDLEVTLQEPLRSSNFSVLPRGEPFTDNRGFASHRYNYRDLGDDLPLPFEIAYTKPDRNPSLTTEVKGTTNTLMTVSIVVGLGAVLGAGLLWVRKSRPQTRATRRRAAKNAPVRAPEESRLPRNFCRHCGQRLESPSRFCPHCGTKLQ
jgi:hypothetical protein